MVTPQFLTKITYLLFCVLFQLPFLTAQNEKVDLARSFRIHTWVWGDGLENNSPLRACTAPFDVAVCQNKLYLKLSRLMERHAVVRMSDQNELKTFVRQYDRLDTISTSEISILGFAFCDSSYMTYRIFVYDLKTRHLAHEFEYYVAGGTTIEVITTKLAEKIYRAYQGIKTPIEEKDDIDKLPTPSEARFEDALFVQRYVQMFNHSVIHRTSKELTPYTAKPNRNLFANKVKHRVQEIVKAITYYKTSKGNYEYLDKQYAAANKQDKIAQGVKKDYPRVWALLEIIVAMEEYKDKPRGESGSFSNKEHLEGTSTSLAKIDLITSDLKQKYLLREQTSMEKVQFDFSAMRQELLIASQMLLNCDSVFMTAERHYKAGELGKATQIYMSILSNKELDELGQLGLTSMKCGKLKDISHDTLNVIAQQKVVVYKNKLMEADDAFWRAGHTPTAMNLIDSLYNQADILNNGLSMYPKLRRVAFLKRVAEHLERNSPNKQVEISKIREQIKDLFPDRANKEALEKTENRIPNNVDRSRPVYDQRTWYNKLIAIAGIVTKHFNAASPNMSTIGQQMIQNVGTDGSKTITLSVQADPKYLKGWVSEINFELGYFASPNEKFVDKRLAAALREIETTFGRDISQVAIEFTGSADGSGFKGKKLAVGEYRDLVASVILCDTRESHEFQKLRQGYWDESTRDIIVRDQNPNPSQTNQKKREKEQTTSQDQAKNTALAFLRAKNRLDHLLELLNGCPLPIKTSICAKVAAEKGMEHRYVNIEFKFSIK